MPAITPNQLHALSLTAQFLADGSQFHGIKAVQEDVDRRGAISQFVEESQYGLADFLALQPTPFWLFGFRIDADFLARRVVLLGGALTWRRRLVRVVAREAIDGSK